MFAEEFLYLSNGEPIEEFYIFKVNQFTLAQRCSSCCLHPANYLCIIYVTPPALCQLTVT